MSVGDSMFFHLCEQEHWPQSLSGDRFLETLTPRIPVKSNLGGLVKVGGVCVCMYVSRSRCIVCVWMHEHNMDTCMTMYACFMYVPVSLHMCISVYTCLCVHVAASVCICICAYLSASKCIRVSMCLRV